MSCGKQCMLVFYQYSLMQSRRGGLERISWIKKEKIIRNGVEGTSKSAEQSTKHCTPHYPSTPITIMQREAAAPPIEHTLDH